jgi:gamma-glutamylaminecyclotransferase
MGTFNLFTYGTLMRGERNEYLLEGARFIGKAKTKPCYGLLSIPGNYSFPALVEQGSLALYNGPAMAIEGELYEVPLALRAGMDQIEGHPFNYRRMSVLLESKTPLGEDIQAVAYILVNESWFKHASLIESGDWRKR